MNQPRRPQILVTGAAGALAVLLATFWFMVRLVKGYLRLCERRLMPPTANQRA